MGRYKQFLIENEEIAEPCASDFETKRSWAAKHRKKSSKKKKKDGTKYGTSLAVYLRGR